MCRTCIVYQGITGRGECAHTKCVTQYCVNYVWIIVAATHKSASHLLSETNGSLSICHDKLVRCFKVLACAPSRRCAEKSLNGDCGEREREVGAAESRSNCAFRMKVLAWKRLPFLLSLIWVCRRSSPPLTCCDKAYFFNFEEFLSQTLACWPLWLLTSGFWPRAWLPHGVFKTVDMTLLSEKL